MRILATSALTPVAAVTSALAALACCPPWGLAAAMGALGLSAFFTRFQAEFLILAVVLLPGPSPAPGTELPPPQSD